MRPWYSVTDGLTGEGLVADGVPDDERRWWKEAVVYQIYPRSFNDTDGDGVGDLPGIVEKADYLDSLGVDLVWLCPVYDSPDVDNGYDIRDFRAIGDDFGDMDDWERLLEALHDRGIRLMMDLVLNHTSDQHVWFERSRRREEGYEDYYRWVDAPPDEPPNNWESIFGGPAWTYDEVREGWYLHLFDEAQPDLNWANPTVRREVHDVVRWWLERGIDGFRMDAISHLAKESGFPDGDPDRSPTGAERYTHAPGLNDYFEELHEAVLSEYDVVTVGEMGFTSIERAAEYARADGNGLDMVFQFDHTSLDAGEAGLRDPDTLGEWDLRELKRIFARRQDALAPDGWDAVFMGNHDQSRVLSRFGDPDGHRRESATLIGTFLLTARGTPYVYQGDEIGMTNTSFDSLAEIDDPETVGHVEAMLSAGEIDSFEEVSDAVDYWCRDHARTPMQWSDGPAAGFTDGEPWLPVNDDHGEVNVAAAAAPDSILQDYRELIDLRDREETLVYGDFELLLPDHRQLFAYTRTRGDDTLLVLLNWSAEPARFEPDADLDGADGATTTLYANRDAPPADPVGAEFRPYEAVVYRIDAAPDR